MSNALTLGFTISNGTISKHSLTDYGLAVANTNYLGDPTMETYTVDVPGRAGILDLSTALTGYPVFKNRTISIEVGAVKTASNWDSFISDLRNNFEGRQCTIIFDNDTTWYWQGRVHITSFDRTRNLGTFNIVMDADAYKYKVTPTTDMYICTSIAATVTIRNTYTHPVTPVFTCTSASGTMNITVQVTGQSSQTVYSLSQGQSMTVPGVNSKSENLSVTVGEVGTMTVTWREMSL